ncbi:hypothetical protein [Parvularcula bermudensis]|nr:hypothetical protein [Parvularcula bermudensis]
MDMPTTISKSTKRPEPFARGHGPAPARLADLGAKSLQQARRDVAFAAAESLGAIAEK